MPEFDLNQHSAHDRGISTRELIYNNPEGDDSSVEISTSNNSLISANLGGIEAIVAPHPLPLMLKPQKAGYFGSPMLFPGRTKQGTSSRSNELLLPINEGKNTLHGLSMVFGPNWGIHGGMFSSQGADLGLDLKLSPENTKGEHTNFPFHLNLVTHYQLLEPHVLKITYYAENIGETVAPFAWGVHLYGTAYKTGEKLKNIDDLKLQLPAKRIVEVDDEMIPLGGADVQTVNSISFRNGNYDFYNGKVIGNREVDQGYTDLTREGKWASSRITNEEQKVQVIIRQDGAFGFLQSFTMDTLAENLQRQGVAVEPMTSSADALNKGPQGGLIMLAPGKTWIGNIEIETKYLG